MLLFGGVISNSLSCPKVCVCAELIEAEVDAAETDVDMSVGEGDGECKFAPFVGEVLEFGLICAILSR